MHFVFTTLGYHPDQPGGAFRCVTEIAEGLADLGHSVHVVYPNPDAAATMEMLEQRHGVHLHRFPAHRAPFLSNGLHRNDAALECIKLASPANHPSILVSCHGYFANAVARSK